MNTHTLTSIAAAAFALAGVVGTCLPAAAQAPPSRQQGPDGKTRAQVVAELAEAIQAGDQPGSGEAGLQLNEQFPSLYPARTTGLANTRAGVRAELAEATRTGEMQAAGESGMTLGEQFPSNYPARSAADALTRAQVKAELAEATRTGDVLGRDETGSKLNQLHPRQYRQVRPAAAVIWTRP
jgi:hypothetical protein